MRAAASRRTASRSSASFSDANPKRANGRARPSNAKRLLREHGAAEARTFFTRLTSEHPEAWINWYGLAKAQSALGDRTAAKKTLEDSARYAVQPQHKAAVKRLLERLAAGQGIG
jgi:predicted Zn-dependent protease